MGGFRRSMMPGICSICGCKLNRVKGVYATPPLKGVLTHRSIIMLLNVSLAAQRIGEVNNGNRSSKNVRGVSRGIPKYFVMNAMKSFSTTQCSCLWISGDFPSWSNLGTWTKRGNQRAGKGWLAVSCSSTR